MSIAALDSNSQSSGLYDIFGVNQTSGVSGVAGVSDHGSGGSAQKARSASGDTVNISAEARELFARKLQMLKTEDEMTEQAMNLGAGAQKTNVDNGLTDEDREAAGVQSEAEPTGLGDAGSAQGAGGGGGGGSSESSDERQEELESQMQSLQSQLVGIMSGPGDPETKEQKAGPVQNRLQSVKAELEAMKSQKAQSAKG